MAASEPHKLTKSDTARTFINVLASCQTLVGRKTDASPEDSQPTESWHDQLVARVDLNQGEEKSHDCSNTSIFYHLGGDSDILL